ncbi:MAG: tetratricopeptide repeat protein, partial [Acidobacteria bacterium]|nr:tetratricopeptide repeat protein [Acidobacteriota bacterium]
GRGRLKLTDFGIVRMPDKQSMAPPSFRPGTTEYMSPEQMRGSEIDARSDIYSLGITFYETLTGKLPSSQPTNSSEDDDRRGYINSAPTSILDLRPEIGSILASIFMRAILRDATERFQTAADFLKAIKDYERNNGVSEAISPTLTEEPATEQLKPVMIAEIAAKSEVPILNQSSIASLTSTSEPPIALSENLQIDLEDEIELDTLDSQPYNGTVNETSANKMIPINLFEGWENKQQGSRKTLIVMAAVAVFFGIYISVYFQTKKQRPAETSAPRPDSSVTSSAGPAITAVDAATPPSKQPEKEVSSGDIGKLRRAVESDSRGRFSQAIANYEAYLRSGPNEADRAAAREELQELRQFQVYVKAARAALKRQNYARARRNYSEALKLRPDSQMVRNGLFRARKRLSAQPETLKKEEERPPSSESKPIPPPG